VVLAPPVAQHASALKRHRQSEKRRQRNKAIKTRLRNLVRSVRESLQGSDAAAARTAGASAARALDKAATKGVIHRNTAARKTARLARALNK
jgi:small subunit ribosomal protein S20